MVRCCAGQGAHLLTFDVRRGLFTTAALVEHGLPGGGDLLVIEGPLRGRQHLPRALGYIKSHRSEYLPPRIILQPLSRVSSARMTELRCIRSWVARWRDDALQHPLTVLEDAGLLRREPDAFRTSRSRVRITEPLITFYHAVMRPERDIGHLERLGRIRQLLIARDRDGAASARLLCFSAAGSTTELRAVERDEQVSCFGGRLVTPAGGPSTLASLGWTFSVRHS